jgi:hypothetical protein
MARSQNYVRQLPVTYKTKQKERLPKQAPSLSKQLFMLLDF